MNFAPSAQRGSFFMLRPWAHRCLGLGIVWLAFSLTLCSIPRCDLLLDLWQAATSDQTDPTDPLPQKLSCHGTTSVGIQKHQASLKRHCPCLLQVFPLVVLSWQSHEPQQLSAERLLAIVITLYTFSVQTGLARLETPPPRL